MNEINLNNLLDSKYSLVKDIVKKHGYNEELSLMLTYIYVAFYLDLGPSCDYPLYDLLDKVHIIYGKGTLNDISKDLGLSPFSEGSLAVTISTPNLSVFSNDSSKQYPQTILLGTHELNYLATPILKLELLLHELRHALMSYYNTNCLINENVLYMRSGLSEKWVNKDGLFIKEMGRIIAETTNSYITELLVNKILDLKKYKINNKELNGYLETLNTNQSDKIYRTLSYNNEVKLLYPLLKNETFINLVNTHEFDGNITLIKDYINNFSTISNYEELSNLMDYFFDNYLNYQDALKNNNNEFLDEYISVIANIKNIVIDIENNFSKTRKRER